jgi:hypothetical protein
MLALAGIYDFAANPSDLHKARRHHARDVRVI